MIISRQSGRIAIFGKSAADVFNPNILFGGMISITSRRIRHKPDAFAALPERCPKGFLSASVAKKGFGFERCIV
jgi:hypothetical protein